MNCGKTVSWSVNREAGGHQEGAVQVGKAVVEWLKLAGALRDCQGRVSLQTEGIEPGLFR